MGQSYAGALPRGARHRTDQPLMAEIRPLPRHKSNADNDFRCRHGGRPGGHACAPVAGDCVRMYWPGMTLP